MLYLQRGTSKLPHPAPPPSPLSPCHLYVVNKRVKALFLTLNHILTLVACCFAEAALQSLTTEVAENQEYALLSTEGSGPGMDSEAWRQLFAQAKVA